MSTHVFCSLYIKSQKMCQKVERRLINRQGSSEQLKVLESHFLPEKAKIRAWMDVNSESVQTCPPSIYSILSKSFNPLHLNVYAWSSLPFPHAISISNLRFFITSIPFFRRFVWGEKGGGGCSEKSALKIIHPFPILISACVCVFFAPFSIPPLQTAGICPSICVIVNETRNGEDESRGGIGKGERQRTDGL